MIFRCLAPVLFAIAAGLAFAQPPGEAPPPTERVQVFRADLVLLRAAIDSGLNLAREDDPLRRAHQCNVLAGMLSRAVQQATAERRLRRASELGLFLQTVLAEGVADNLELARRSAPPDAWSGKEVQRFSGLVAAVAAPIEQLPADLPASQEKASMQAVAEQVGSARQRVETILKGKGPPPGKGLGKGLHFPKIRRK